MTALSEFERLECQGIWRASQGAQRRDVIVSVGEATLTMSSLQEAVAHWSLPAVERVNPGERPAIFRPGPDAEDLLELTDDTMIQAIAKVQSAIKRRRPHPGRLRLGLLGSGTLAIAALAIFWLPGAMMDYTASVVPASKRTAIGENLLTNIRRISGKSCDSALGTQSLRHLHTRLFGSAPGKIIVLAGGVKQAQHLPGNIVLVNRALVEDHEEVDVAAGFVIIEKLRAKTSDPLVRLLRDAGISTAFGLLTTGDVSEPVLAAYAETLLTSEPEILPEQSILTQFRSIGVRSSPYAYAIDFSGETTIGLIEADAGSETGPLLDDSDWVSLQEICGE